MQIDSKIMYKNVENKSFDLIGFCRKLFVKSKPLFEKNKQLSFK